MIIFRGMGSFGGGPYLATVDECLWYAERVDMVLGYVNEDLNNSFSLRLDLDWFKEMLSEMDPKREIFAYVYEYTNVQKKHMSVIDHTELAIGGWVTWGKKMAAAQVIRCAKQADEVYGYVQFNRRDGLLYPMGVQQVEDYFGDSVASRKVFAYYYDHPNRTVLRIGGEE